MARVRANLAALRLLRTLQAEERPATAAEQAVLARWSGWGAVPQVFDADQDDPSGQDGGDAGDARADGDLDEEFVRARRGQDWSWARAELAELLSPPEYAAARRTTLNAHYTDAALVAAVWAGLGRLGFGGGRVLEPGCGSGNFVGFAPASASMVGVELDPVTAGVTAALYPDAQILAESFADTRAPEGSFDAVVGNVPFGAIQLHDRVHNGGGHSIHNHFIVKSLALTRPGGLVAVLTSRYTLDARNPAARREIAAMADLVGAIRLPTGAHRRAAGTNVVTDLLVFRRREADRPADGIAWEQVRRVTVPGGEVEVNEYFAERPEAVLGESVFATAAYRPDLVVKASGDVPAALATALDRLAADAADRGLLMSERDLQARPVDGPLLAAAEYARKGEGHIEASPAGGFTQVCGGVPERFAVPASQAVELRALLVLRDTVTALLTAESTSREDTEEVVRLRAALNSRYDAYAVAYGPINRFTWKRTGRVDPDTGEQRMARIRPRQGGFRDDPSSAAVYALEDFDSTDQRATKMAVFRQRVVAPRTARLGADTPADAVAISLDAYGELRLPEVARLLGVDAGTAREALGELVFDEPGTGRVVPAAEYLSGNVRIKLEQARAAAQDDPRFEANAEALARVLPPDIGVDRITALLGAVWIPASDVQAFLRATLADPTLRVEHPGGAVWGVKGAKTGVLATSTWGTVRYPAPALAGAILEQRTITVYDEYEEGGRTYRVVNMEETAAAQEKAGELADRFAEWVWEDSERTDRLVAEYNRLFNSVVGRVYDGSYLSLPGLAADFEPYPHQRAAVARIIHEPATLLAHAVGAGKTAEMIMGVMELRRLGVVGKTGVVVPNHLLEQFRNDFLRLYPQANVLAAGTEDLTGDRRRQFVARVATGNYDAVIISRGAFEGIPMSAESQQAYFDQELQSLRALADTSKKQGGMTTKRLEAAVLRAEERLKKHVEKANRSSGTVTFEQTGLDSLAVDELHYGKNLRTASNIPGVAIDGSARATDLHQKIEYLRRRGPTRIIGATATPLANSISELHVWMRMLRPDRLAESRVENFDAWANTFGEVVTAVELAPAGNRVRLHARFARFKNVRGLMVPWLELADIKTAKDLNLPRPALRGGRPETLLLPASPALQDYMTSLGDRADATRGKRPQKGEDNMLTISNDGAAASLDLRLVGHQTDPGWATKIDLVAQRIHNRWLAHRDDVYLAVDGSNDPVRGSLQLVFSDLGTPAEDWNVYDQLRDQLVELGMPAEQLRYIHQARNDREKAEMFAAARAGRIAVLMGSTGKMGEGTNVQRRGIALYHLDCPWRPIDLEQRDGRLWRQGNANPEIEIVRVVAERSFDAYKYQANERKAAAFAQVIRSTLPDVDELDDISDEALDFAAVKAVAAGDPHMHDRALAESDLSRLQRLERHWHREQDRLRGEVAAKKRKIERLTERIAQIDAAAERRHDTSGDAFTITLQGRRYDKRPAAGNHLYTAVTRLISTTPIPSRATDLGHLGGFDLVATVTPGLDGARGIRLTLADLPEGTIPLTADEVQAASPTGLITRLENRLGDLERHRGAATKKIEECRAEIERATGRIGGAFRQHDQLLAARERLQHLNNALTGRAAEDAKEAEAARDLVPAAANSPDEDTTTTPPRPATASNTTAPAAGGGRTRPTETPGGTSGPGRLDPGPTSPPTSTPGPAAADATSTHPPGGHTPASDRSPAQTGDTPAPPAREAEEAAEVRRAVLNAGVDSGRVVIIPVGPPDTDTPAAAPAPASQPPTPAAEQSGSAWAVPPRLRFGHTGRAPQVQAAAIEEYVAESGIPAHQVQAVLRDAGMVYRGRGDAWTLPEQWRRETHTARVKQIRAALEQLTNPPTRPAQPDAAAATPDPQANEPAAPVDPPAADESADTPTGVATPRPGAIRVEHLATGTLVHATPRYDEKVRAALKAARFRWSNRIGEDGAWYLNSRWGYDARSRHVATLVNGLAPLDRDVDVWLGGKPEKYEGTWAIDRIRRGAAAGSRILLFDGDPTTAPTPEQIRADVDEPTAAEPDPARADDDPPGRVDAHDTTGADPDPASTPASEQASAPLVQPDPNRPADSPNAPGTDADRRAGTTGPERSDQPNPPPAAARTATDPVLDHDAAPAPHPGIPGNRDIPEADRQATTPEGLDRSEHVDRVAAEDPPTASPPEDPAGVAARDADAPAPLSGEGERVSEAPSRPAPAAPASLPEAAPLSGLTGDAPAAASHPGNSDPEPPEQPPSPPTTPVGAGRAAGGQDSLFDMGPSPAGPPERTPKGERGPSAPPAALRPDSTPSPASAAAGPVPEVPPVTPTAAEPASTPGRPPAAARPRRRKSALAKAREAEQTRQLYARANAAKERSMRYRVCDLAAEAVAHVPAGRERNTAKIIWEQDYPLAQYDEHVRVTLARVDGPLRDLLAVATTDLRADLVAIGEQATADYLQRIAEAGSDSKRLHAVYYQGKGIQGDSVWPRAVCDAVERRIDQAVAAATAAGLSAEDARAAVEDAVGWEGDVVLAEGTTNRVRPHWGAAMTPRWAAQFTAFDAYAAAIGDHAYLAEDARLRDLLAQVPAPDEPAPTLDRDDHPDPPALSPRQDIDPAGAAHQAGAAAPAAGAGEDRVVVAITGGPAGVRILVTGQASRQVRVRMWGAGLRPEADPQPGVPTSWRPIGRGTVLNAVQVEQLVADLTRMGVVVDTPADQADTASPATQLVDGPDTAPAAEPAERDLGREAVAHLPSAKDQAHAYWVWHRVNPLAQFDHNVTVAVHAAPAAAADVLVRHARALRQDLVAIGDRTRADLLRRAAQAGTSRGAADAAWRAIAADPTYARRAGAAIEHHQDRARAALVGHGMPADAAGKTAGEFFAAVVGRAGTTGPAGADGQRTTVRYGWAAMMPVAAAKAAAHTALRAAVGDRAHVQRLREIRAMLAADPTTPARQAAVVAARVLDPTARRGASAAGGRPGEQAQVCGSARGRDRAAGPGVQIHNGRRGRS